MRLLFVQETDWLKRNPHQQHHLAEMLSMRGHEIRVIDYELLWKTEDRKKLCSRRQALDAPPKIYPDAKITVIRPGIIKVPVLDYVSLLFTHRKEIKRQIREFAPEVIIGLGILNSYLAAREAAKRNIPFIYYWLDVLHRLIPTKVFQPFGKIAEKRILGRTDITLVLNDRLKDYVVALGADADRTRVLGAGIDIKLFRPDGQGAEVRRQYGIKENDIILFFMGWLYHFSGIKEVALQLAKSESHNFKLLIVGEGDAYDELKKIQETNQAQDKIILAGRKPYEQIPSFIAAADICLLPAYATEEIMQDIVPIKMYEYMAMSKPVITTKLPGIMREFGEDNGIVYVNRPEEVPDKAAELIRQNQAAELGRKARRFAEGRSWDSIADKFEEILREAIAEKQKRGTM
jgi:glycosyltransferase involved in cell wall biosynthesis